jgi:hypothetical protein
MAFLKTQAISYVGTCYNLELLTTLDQDQASRMIGVGKRGGDILDRGEISQKDNKKKGDDDDDDDDDE